MSEGATPRHTNRLIDETSPYLLQHAHNPVDWHPWGEEALALAKEKNRPILLSIGYSACHWCHVMERESFENEAIARQMNESFVCIKVDREERPDLDEIYMAATVAMNHGQGGWPMTVFLTPDQEPFFAGTYFPPHDMYGRPGFASLLSHLSNMWHRDPDACRRQAGQLVSLLRHQASSSSDIPVGEDEISAAVEQLERDFDPRYGGFGMAPKFPPSQALSLLLKHHRRTGHPGSLDMVVKTLDAMAYGGMYDQIGGGFARYSTDERWLVPHFEKMLYDNAQLAKVYLEGWQATGASEYGRVAREILDYVITEMTSPEGGFYSSTDADSEGEEGKFFVFTPQEIREILPAPDAEWFCNYYDISSGGNWEGKSIPNVPSPLPEVAQRLQVAPEELADSLRRSRGLVYAARAKRVPPGLDDKVLTSWNGLMIGAMAEGYRALRDRRYLDAARNAADFVLDTLTGNDGCLLRTFREGKAHIDGFLEDYAYLAEGLLDLYEATGEIRWRNESRRLADDIRARFGSAEGSFYNTAAEGERLIVRNREGNDGATPSPNAVAAHLLARLSHHYGKPELREAAVAALRSFGQMMKQHPRAFPRSLSVVELLLHGPVELALVVNGSDQGEAFAAELGRRHLPDRTVAMHDLAQGPAPDHPLLADRNSPPGCATLYVCRDFVCQAPITDPSRIDEALSRIPEGTARRTIGSRRPGHATVAGTKALAERFASVHPHGYLSLPGCELSVSRLGFGGYRIDDETPEHGAALEAALLGGCNLIDTSTNYTDGSSERLVGRMLGKLQSSGRIDRSEIVVVSKIGYVQGKNLELAQQQDSSDDPFPEMVKYMDECWHCIHPRWLDDQLQRSLDRLQLDTLDVCLLHNPEYFLTDAKKRGRETLDSARNKFYERLHRAFEFLEEQVRAGTILHYGVSSNTLGAPPDDPEATSLSRIREAAERAGGPENHLRFVQLPLNLIETGPATRPNTGPDGTRTALAEATEGGLAVLVNRPLNAIAGDRMIRLADFDEAGREARNLDELQGRVAELEREFAERIAPEIAVPPGATRPERYFQWSSQLQGYAPSRQGLPHWRQIESQLVLPQVQHVCEVLDRSLAGDVADRWSDWRSRYLAGLNLLLDEIRRQSAVESQRQSDEVSLGLDPLLPEAQRGETLSRKALWVLTSTPGVATALVGMRSRTYVEDALAVLSWPPLEHPASAYEALGRPG